MLYLLKLTHRLINDYDMTWFFYNIFQRNSKRSPWFPDLEHAPVCTAVCRRKNMQSVGDQMYRAIISVLSRCEGSAKSNATDARIQHNAETVRTIRLAQLNRSNRSSANSAYSATKAVFKETLWVRCNCDAHMSKGGSVTLREACALSVSYCEQRNVRMGAW